jgi:hypothetical protein
MATFTSDILAEARQLTQGDRNTDYGHPLDDYEKTARLWSVVLGVEVTPAQAALCMCCVKISREINRHKRDNLVDLAGYAWVVDEIHEEAARRDHEQ